MLRARASTDLPGTPAAGGAAQHMTGDGPGSDEGSAALEFILVGLVLLVPIVYLIVALGLIQGQSLGVETGARQLARTIAESPDAATADARGKRVLDAIVAEYGLDPGAVSVSIDCDRSSPECPAAGAMLSVTVRTSVPLPLVPAVLGLDQLARVPVEAASVQRVSRFWGVAP